MIGHRDESGADHRSWDPQHLLRCKSLRCFKAGLTLIGHSSPDIACHSARIGVLNFRIRYCSRRPAQILARNFGLKNAE
jgi:hypothetical protein